MSKSIFPVKLLALIIELGNSNAMANHEQPYGSVRSPEDKKTRFMLLSPEIGKAAGNITMRDYTKLYKRLAVPRDAMGCNGPMVSMQTIVDETMFEIYDIEGQLLFTSKVVDLEGDLALALQVELLDAILRTKGTQIPFV